MKKCSKCKELKASEKFQKKARNKDGLASICKTCKRAYDNAHYAKNSGRKEYIKENSRRRILRNRAWILDYLSGHPCIDCGETDPVVLEFDHKDNKVIPISIAVSQWSLPRLQEEVGKCDVRCANCHRRKTASDFKYWKAEVA